MDNGAGGSDVVTDSCVWKTATSSDLGDMMSSLIADEVGQAKYRKHFAGVARFGRTPDGICVHVPTSFQRDWMTRWFGATVEAAARGVLGSATAQVSWRVDGLEHATDAPAADPGSALPPTPPEPAPPGSGGAGRGPRGSRTPWMRLEDYIVGDCNRSAWNAARAIGEDRSPVSTVLFLHGECGMGKTHLLQGAARRFADVHPGARVRCTTAECFANEYIASVREGRIKAFRARYRELDLLCLDDVHFIGGKKGTQSEFLHTFNALGEVRARVVVASDAHPKVLREVQESIVSRFVSGMVERVDAPDRDTRRRIVAAIAARRGVRLAPDAAEAVADAAPGSVRELCGAVARVEACARLEAGADPHAEVTSSCVRRALGPASMPGPAKPVRMDDIARAASETLGVELSDVYGPSRHRRAVLARSVAVCLAKEFTMHSFPEIARMLHRRNHSTVVTQRKRLRAEMDRGAKCRCGGDLDAVRVADLYDRIRARVVTAAR